MEHIGEHVDELLIRQQSVGIVQLPEEDLRVLAQSLLVLYGQADVLLVNYAILAVAEQGRCQVRLFAVCLALNLYGQQLLYRTTDRNLEENDS